MGQVVPGSTGHNPWLGERVRESVGKDFRKESWHARILAKQDFENLAYDSADLVELHLPNR